MTYINQEIWRACLAGWLITDVAVRDQNLLYLCLREDVPHDKASGMWDHDIKTTFCLIRLQKPNDPFGSLIFEGYNKPRLGVSLRPKPQGLLVARNNDGQVYPVGGQDTKEEFIDPGKVPMPWRIKTLGGYAYSVGNGRSIYKRADIAKWIKLDKGFPAGDATTEQGFEDMDAFSETDMYAVGGHGDVWHFDGKEWKQMGFPSNVQLGTVTCAGDGNVYISGEGGSLWVGQKSTWKRVYQGGSSVLWNDVLWFEGKLWLASDYQFCTWDGQAMRPVLNDNQSLFISGHMDARDGILAIASQQYVMVFDGKTWRTIVAPYVTT